MDSLLSDIKSTNKFDLCIHILCLGCAAFVGTLSKHDMAQGRRVRQSFAASLITIFLLFTVEWMKNTRMLLTVTTVLTFGEFGLNICIITLGVVATSVRLAGLRFFSDILYTDKNSQKSMKISAWYVYTVCVFALWNDNNHQCFSAIVLFSFTCLDQAMLDPCDTYYSEQ